MLLVERHAAAGRQIWRNAQRQHYQSEGGKISDLKCNIAV